MQAGYESIIFMLNMGLPFYVFVFAVIFLVMLRPLKWCCRRSKKATKKLNSYEKDMKYNFFVRFFLEISLEVAICSFMNIDVGSWNSEGNHLVNLLGMILSWLFFGVFIIFVLWATWLLTWG
jgi:hypothetical protein